MSLRSDTQRDLAALPEVSDFATCSIAGSGLQRQPHVPKDYRTDEYSKTFDVDTLWIDAIQSGNRVILVCPRLNNLRSMVHSAVVRIDGQEVSKRVRDFRRHSTIEVRAQRLVKQISIEIGNWRGETDVHTADYETFRGRNSIFTLSKDNDLEWIHDFGRFHVHHHNADAMLFVDNGTSAYGPSEIEETLKCAGLSTVIVLRTGLSYGPRAKRPYRFEDQHLQSCIMNIARLRFLHHARAVLNCDIDELVYSPNASIFDLARSSPFGFVRFAGEWRFPLPEHEGPARHAAHIFKRPAAKVCSPKWCIVPSGPLGRFQWRPHSLDNLPFSRAFKTQKASFWHCRAVSNDWKGYGRLETRDDTVPEPSAALALKAAGIV